MTTPHHHPDEAVLWDYHRGRLPAGMALVARAHIEACARCREDLALYDAIGGALLSTVDGVDMSSSALDLALARIERPDIERSEAGRAPAKAKPHRAFLQGFELPESLRDAAIRNRYWAAPGVWMAPIDIGGEDDVKTYLMFVKGGMVMPEHSHRGFEATLVLKGSFSDSFGTYERGDLAIRDENDSHSPAIASAEDCLCLVAQAGTIIPKTWLGRILQPLARI
ncbi:MAG: ChrR family anti-sigma-E factor [Asticcacaulis sp.]|uniref:ChrR family anti-sigma-E factor n=1 Tax=Asticcacaulis sp. TaxID=1872648 RepID=UPI003F7B913C